MFQEIINSLFKNYLVECKKQTYGRQHNCKSYSSSKYYLATVDLQYYFLQNYVLIVLWALIFMQIFLRLAILSGPYKQYLLYLKICVSTGDFVYFSRIAFFIRGALFFKILWNSFTSSRFGVWC